MTRDRTYIVTWLRAYGAHQLADFLASPPRCPRPWGRPHHEYRPVPTIRVVHPGPADRRYVKRELQNMPGLSSWCRNGSHWACMGSAGRQGDVCLCPNCRHPLTGRALGTHTGARSAHS